MSPQTIGTLNETIAERALQDALEIVRKKYRERGEYPTRSKIAEVTGLSDSSVQRYLADKPYDHPKYENILSIARAIGLQTSDLALEPEVAKQMDKRESDNVVLEMRRLNIEELKRTMDDEAEKWRERLDAERKAHMDEIVHLNKAHAEEIANLNKIHAEEMKRAIAANQENLRIAQETHAQHTRMLQEVFQQQFSQLVDVLAKKMYSPTITKKVSSRSRNHKQNASIE